MKVIVLGGTGLLGEALIQRCRSLGHEAVAASRSSGTMPLDVADTRQLSDAIAAIRPDVVINCAAITSIDACEAQPGKAYVVNAAPVGELARLSNDGRFKLVQVSTDHFFSGDGRARHDENAPVTLLNEYAKTKYAAESFAALSPAALVVRTAFVGRGSRRDRGFAEHLHEALLQARQLTLFQDAYTSLLHRSAVADLILQLIERNASGVFNVASRDVFSKADLIRAFADKLGLRLNARLGSVRSLKVVRAESLGLATAKTESVLGCRMPGFEETVARLAADFSSLESVSESAVSKQ